MYKKKGNPMCPFLSFKRQFSRLHPALGNLWQRPLDLWELSHPTWYGRIRLGTNMLSSMMSEVSKTSNLSEVYTNHRATSIQTNRRAISVTALTNAGVESHLMQISVENGDINS